MILPLVIALAMVAIILPPVLKWKENKLAVVVFYMLVLTQAFVIWYVVPLLPHFSSHLGPAQAFCISLISALVLNLVFGGLLRKAKGAADIMWSITVHACLLVLWTWMFPELGLLNIGYAFIVALMLFIPDFFIARPIAALSCNATT
jgi:hypothetical protein